MRRTTRRLSILAAGAALFTVLVATEASADTAALAQSGRVGLGLGGSNLTSGVSGKLYLTENQALQGTLGYWWTWGVAASADYLYEMPTLVSHEALTLHWYFGAGATIGSAFHAFALSVQGVGGLALQIREFPVEVAIELRPTVRILRNPHVYLGTGGSIRYFF